MLFRSPNQFNLKSVCWIVQQVATPIAYNINITPTYNVENNNINLKGPNFNLPIQNQINNKVSLDSTGNVSITPTWNNAATIFTGLKVNITDTASNASSNLMDLQVGGVSQFKVRKDGNIYASQMFCANGGGYFNSNGSTGLYLASNGLTQIKSLNQYIQFYNGGGSGGSIYIDPN